MGISKAIYWLMLMTLWRHPKFQEYFPINFYNNHNDWTEKMEIYKFEYIRNEASFANKKKHISHFWKGIWQTINALI